MSTIAAYAAIMGTGVRSCPLLSCREKLHQIGIWRVTL